MPASISDISEWFDEAKKIGATHMIVVCDTFDHDDYPVSVMKYENVKNKKAEYDKKSMQRVMEVYNLSMNKAKQMSQKLTLNY